MIKRLYQILAIISCGFYVHPACWGFENPAHPRSAEEIQEEQRKEERKTDPCRGIENEDQRKACDDGDATWAEKSMSSDHQI